MVKSIVVGKRTIGNDFPAFIVAEIGINHNGSVELAKKLIDAAVAAGCDAVKFQKRTPEICVPLEQRDVKRETPWGLMTYLDYRHRIELDESMYREIDTHCRIRGINWFASCWDIPSVDFILRFQPACLKIASACLTDDKLLKYHRRLSIPLLLSTGMSTLDEIDHAVEVLGTEELILLHATSSYPAKLEELNLQMIQTLYERYSIPIGYSGHEVGLSTSVAAAVLGACVIERHITLDRSLWGSDQAASVEPPGFSRLVRDIRAFEAARGDGVKRIYPSELPIRQRLRIRRDP